MDWLLRLVRWLVDLAAGLFGQRRPATGSGTNSDVEMGPLKVDLGLPLMAANAADRQLPPDLHRLFQQYELDDRGRLSTHWKCAITIDGRERVYLIRAMHDLTTGATVTSTFPALDAGLPAPAVKGDAP